MSTPFSRFWPASIGETPVPPFLDTSAIVAHEYPNATRHREARSVIQAIGAHELPYDPPVTNQHVLDEVALLLLSRAGTRIAQQAPSRVLATGTFRVLDVEPSLVDRAIVRFQEYSEVRRPVDFAYRPRDRHPG